MMNGAIVESSDDEFDDDFDALSPTSLVSPRNAARGEHRDRYFDEQHDVPFRITDETFPVPSSIPDSSAEMWFPGTTLRISYVTWNMGHKEPNLHDVASYCIHPNAHIIVVCTQENGSNVGGGKQQKKWAKYVEDFCLKGQYKLVGKEELWYVQLLVFARQKDVASYVSHVNMSHVRTGIVNGLGGNKGGVAVALLLSMLAPSPLHGGRNGETDASLSSVRTLFTPREENEDVVQLSVITENRRHVIPEKGSHLSLLFIGAHLAAHQKAVDLRNKDYHTITRFLRVGLRGRDRSFYKNFLNKRTSHMRASMDNSNMQRRRSNLLRNDNESEATDEFAETENALSLMRLPFHTPPESTDHRDVTDEYDLTFFGGDLNYRINGTRKAIEYIIKRHKDIRSILVNNDQLNLERAKGVVFRGFHEGNLLFRPTYKYEVDNTVTLNEYNFSGKKNRMPAYCDRVLYKKRKNLRATRVKIRLYTDVPEVRTSDHRPVVALFDISTEAFRVPLHSEEVSMSRDRKR